MSRASCQPTITSVITTQTWSAVVPAAPWHAAAFAGRAALSPNSVDAVDPEQDHADEERDEHEQLQPRAARYRRRETERQPDLAQRLPPVGRPTSVAASRCL